MDGMVFDCKMCGEKTRECREKMKSKHKLAFAASYRQFLRGNHGLEFSLPLESEKGRVVPWMG